VRHRATMGKLARVRPASLPGESSPTTTGRRPGAPLDVLVVVPSDAAQDGGGQDGEGQDGAGQLLRIVRATDRLRPTVHRIGTGRRSARALGDVLRLVTVLRSEDPDVVLASGAEAAAAAIAAATVTGHRTVAVVDGPESDLPARVTRRAAVVMSAPAVAEGDDPVDPLVAPPAAADDGSAEVPLGAAAHRLAGVLAEAVGRPGAGMDPAVAPPMSVVVPVWREGALVDDLVSALLPQLRPDDELILVDDGSPDDTGERVERAAADHPQVRAVRQHPNAGAAAARNAGVAVARHACIAFTDAGCHWGEGWLDGMRVPFAETPRPDLVAGAYRVSRRTVFEAASAVGCYPDVGEVRRAGPVTTAWSVLFGRRFDPTRPAGRAMAVTRDALDEVGGWPEAVRAHEDLDLSRSIAERGLTCVLTTDADLLWDQAGLRGTLRMYVRYGRGDAEAADRQALLRDIARAGAYVVGALGLVWGGTRARAALAAAAVAYVWVPLARARREERPLATAALVPPVIMMKDLAKVWGVLEVVRERAGSR
jgi:glycosyl transferase family 2